jgi:hypothetical protein
MKSVKSESQEARSSRRTVQLTRQNLAINAWTNLMQLIMNHLSHIIGRSREQFRQNMEMSNRMMGTIAQMGREMGYLTPMADSVKAIARGAAQVPESVLPPPPAPEDQAQNYSQLCEKRDVCAHPTTRRYYAKGYWLICDQCGRRWKSVNGKWIVDDKEDPLRVPTSTKSLGSSSRSRPAASTMPKRPVKSSASSSQGRTRTKAEPRSPSEQAVPTDEEDDENMDRASGGEETDQGWDKLPRQPPPRRGPRW